MRRPVLVILIVIPCFALSLNFFYPVPPSAPIGLGVSLCIMSSVVLSRSVSASLICLLLLHISVPYYRCYYCCLLFKEIRVVE